jgi:proline dehydrogenase
VSRRNQEDAKLRMARENVAAAAAAEEARKAKAATKTDKHGKSKSPPKNNGKSGKLTKLSPPYQVAKKGKGKEKAVPKNGRGKR